MSINPNNMKTKDLLIEACPTCHTVHCYAVDMAGKIIIDAKPRDFVLCPTVLGQEPPTEEELKADPKKKPVNILCGYEVKPKPENMFTIRIWTYREKTRFYEMMGVYAPQNITPGQTASVRLNINPTVMDYVLTTATVKAPQPLNSKADLDKCTLDGSILEVLYGEITDFNGPPLAPSSTSLQRSTLAMRTSARAIN
jgi:hypothetical protein